MAGFFEFSMMRVRDDIDQQLLAELFYQYITVEDDFILALFTNGETQLGRVFVNEPALAGARPAKGAPAKGVPAKAAEWRRPAAGPPATAPSTSWTTNAPARSSRRRSTWAWASATAATRRSTSAGPARRP